MNRQKRISVTTFVHQLLKEHLQKGDVVVDATLGNGKDAVFLYKLIGKEGRLYGFDIQEISVTNTKRLLMTSGIENTDNIELILDGHENIEKYIKEQIDCCIFNLGYLPGGSHSIVTRPNTTIRALAAALRLLKSGGIITIAIYYGHEGGKEEKESLLSYLTELPFEAYNVMQWYTINNHNNPPIVVVIEKK